MAFTTTREVFRLPRKVSRLPKEIRATQQWLYITDITPAQSRPGKCIQIDNDEHMYLAGPGLIPTHNTALVQALAQVDSNRDYYELDLARMISGLASPDQMAALIKALFDEAEQYATEQRHELVLLIDEFHQIVQLSAAAVEALKPVLAASGARGLRVIAATTFDEFHQHVRPNQPLVERLQRINLTPPNRETTVQILRGMARTYEVEHEFYDDSMFETIYELTERYMPASVQPRKSILVFDSMVGWHRFTKRSIDMKLLAEVLQESAGVNVAFSVDAKSIKAQLDQKVLSQDFATRVVAKRLQLCVADLHDKSKPASSFLFTGSTGVGKTELVKQLARLLFGDDQRHLIRFDMSEYALDESVTLLRSELTQRVWSMGHSVLLFDEIEKAASTVTRVLLQVLDDGRLSDENGRQVSFLNCYIVLTTNAGAEIYKTIQQYSPDDDGSGTQMLKRMREIRRAISTTQGDNRFPPELLGRIDAIVPFQPLSLETRRKITKNKLRELMDEVHRKHRVQVVFDRRVLDYLVEDKADSDSDAGGARAALSLMADEVTAAIAAYVNEHPECLRIRVQVAGTLRSENKNLLESDAVVEVVPLG
ncbi:MAG: AAA family ATPase [Candidatus Lumbricidophila eiseniae]|uniref:AAA family ATPase n=1 Tax=Candidatus Lumbricidiphila eiseniae TaxID=1969409 RepID=A0A2A6FSI4_9MICO|nr:MAG: AAA family ATPase [Candidatus Lumbricidophila eiseniae]